MKQVAGLALALVVASVPSVVHAQDAWPNRPITFVVPYAAGGYTDLVARLTARYVEKALGKPVVVENRAGRRRHRGDAGGRECGAGRLHLLRLQHRRDLDRALRPRRSATIRCRISRRSASSARSSQAVIVKKDLPVKSMAELVSYAKANPGKLNYGSSGAGG